MRLVALFLLVAATTAGQITRMSVTTQTGCEEGAANYNRRYDSRRHKDESDKCNFVSGFGYRSSN